jgi:AAHS family 4-hydroxybenzoate transporter-like MFS transporter
MSKPVLDVGRLLDEGQWGGYQRLLVFLTGLAIIFDGADNQLLGVSIPLLIEEWAVARSDFAPVLALGFLGMMIGGAVAGVLGDRYGRRLALAGSVLAFGIATAATARVGGLGSLAALRFLAGIGLGGAMPNAAALASEFVPTRHRPFAVTLTIVCIPVGGTLAGLLAIRVLPALGWRGLFGIGGLLPVLFALLMLRAIPESPRFLARHPRRWPELIRGLTRMGFTVPADASFVDRREEVAGKPNAGALFSPEFRRDTLALWGAFFFCLFAVYLGFNWVPSMLTGSGLSPTVGSTGITAFNLGGVVGALLGAYAISRVGSRLTMLVMAGAAAVAALVMRGMEIGPAAEITLLIAMLALTGGLINAVQTTMYALASHVYPTAVRATGVGSAVAVGRAGAILSTFAGAWALEAGGSAAFFTVIGAAMVMVVLTLAAVKRHVAPRRAAEAAP